MSETEAATARTEPERPPGLVDVVPASRLWNVCKPRQSRLPVAPPEGTPRAARERARPDPRASRPAPWDLLLRWGHTVRVVQPRRPPGDPGGRAAGEDGLPERRLGRVIHRGRVLDRGQEPRRRNQRSRGRRVRCGSRDPREAALLRGIARGAVPAQPRLLSGADRQRQGVLGLARPARAPGQPRVDRRRGGARRRRPDAVLPERPRRSDPTARGRCRCLAERLGVGYGSRASP